MPTDVPERDPLNTVEERIDAVTVTELDAYAKRIGVEEWFTRRLDEDKLPAELRERARLYEATRGRVHSAETEVIQTATRYGAVIFALLGMYPLFSHVLEPETWKLVLGPVLWAVAALVAFTGHRVTRDPVPLTTSELDQILDATSTFELPLTAAGIRAPTSDPYGTVAGIRQQWANGQPRREAQLVYVAAAIIDDIQASPAWSDPVFDTHRVRLDLTTARREIFEHASQMWQIDSAVIPPASQDSAVADQWRRHREAVDDAWTALVARVCALHAYREGMRPVETILQDLAAVQSLTTSANRITCLDDLFTATAKAQLETTHARQLAGELPELAANLQAQLEFLRTGAIHMPALAAPLPVTSAR